MKNVKGIVCTTNVYKLNGFAVVDGRACSVEDIVTVRNAREDKKRVALALGVKPSQCIVNYKLNKRKFIIDVNDIDGFINLLKNNGISVIESGESDTDSED